MIRSIAIGIVAALLAAITSRFMDGLLNELIAALIVGGVVGLGGTFAFRAAADGKYGNV